MKAFTNKFILLLAVSTILYIGSTKAQSPPKDEFSETSSSVYAEAFFASNDGRYAAFQERFVLNGSMTQDMVIKDLSTEKEIRFKGLHYSKVVGFSNDSQYFIYQDRSVQGRYYILDVAAGRTSSVNDVKQWNLLKGKLADKALYQSQEGELYVYSLPTGRKQDYGKTETFSLKEDGVTVELSQKDNAGKLRSELLDLGTGKRQLVSENGNYTNIMWDSGFRKMAYLEQQADRTTVVVFDRETGKTTRVMDDADLRRGSGQQISGLGNFVAEGQSLELSLKPLPVNHPTNSLTAKVIIWSYFDERLQPNKHQNPAAATAAKQALLLIGSGKVVPLEGESTVFRGQVGPYYCILDKSNKQYSIISAKDGSRRSLTGLPLSNDLYFTASSDGNYFLYYYKNNYHGYDVRNQHSVNLTGATGTLWHDLSYVQTESAAYYSADGFAKALTGSRFRVGDQYDLWILDASGKQAPVCLTGGYGRKNKVVLKAVVRGTERNDLMLDGKLLLSGLGELDRKRSFFTCKLAKPGIPEKLLSEDAVFGDIAAAGNGKRFFIYRETAGTPANWFTTTDFRTLSALGSVQSADSSKGLNAEIMVGREVDGKPVRLVLYTPKNFDPSKKYPVIVNYYEEKTADGFRALKTEPIGADINIPWFVNKGYLVMQPDFHYVAGAPGEGALKCINAAVDELIKRPYVDSTRIGINGHSYGGYETLYIVTHSSRFKAAMAGAPVSDIVSLTNTLSGTFIADNNPKLVENGQMRIWTTLWDRPDFFIKSSPVFEADKVSIPLLMMHSRKDGNVPFEQGMEFFMAMRRLGKTCWLLEYEDERHTVDDWENKKDYTIRMTQFYDHYLKDAPAPVWMIEGMKYKDRKYMPGYELDTQGRKPGAGINSPEEQKRIDEYSKIPLTDKLKRVNQAN